MFTVKVEACEPLDVVLSGETVSFLDGGIKMEVEELSDDEMNWSVRKYALYDPDSYEELKKKGIFTCEVCPRMFLNRFKLVQHKVSHLKVNLSMPQTYDCDHCSATYIKKTSLAKHIRYRHGNPKTCDLPEKMRDCKICKKTFKYKHWHEHMKNVHNPKASWPCSLCSKKFKSERYLFRHNLYIHEKLKPQWMFKKKEKKHSSSVLQCLECTKTFKYDDCLRLHMKNVHPKKGIVTCKICSSVMKCENYLLRHMKRFHSSDGRQYLCKMCPKNFKSLEYLNRHVRNVHNSEKVKNPKATNSKPKNITCVKNVKKTETGGERWHTLEKPLKIAATNKITYVNNANDPEIGGKRWYTLDKPLKIARTNKITYVKKGKKPETGGKREHTLTKPLKSKMTYVKNVKKSETSGKREHTLMKTLKIASTNKVTYVKNGKNPQTSGEPHSLVEVYQCLECTKTFTIKARLTRHMQNLHSEIGTFTCNICSSVMKCERYLKNHMRRVHYNDGRRHSCTMCFKMFNSADYLNSHMRRMHNIGKRKPKEITPQSPVAKEIEPEVLLNHVKLENANVVRMEALLKKEDIFEGNGEVLIDLGSGPITSIIEFPLDWEDL